VSERFNVAREVRGALEGTPERALQILPALAGEILAGGDVVAVADLRDALGLHVLNDGTNHQVADAVLAMVRTYGITAAAHFGC
jgi:hypothetical protein